MDMLAELHVSPSLHGKSPLFCDVINLLFSRMFESYPDLKSAFGPFKHLNHHDASYEEVLRAHGVRVVNIVELVLNLWQNEEEVIQNLHELGRRHLTFSAKVEYVDVSTLESILKIQNYLQLSIGS